MRKIAWKAEKNDRFALGDLAYCVVLEVGGCPEGCHKAHTIKVTRMTRDVDVQECIKLLREEVNEDFMLITDTNDVKKIWEVDWIVRTGPMAINNADGTVREFGQ